MNLTTTGYPTTTETVDSDGSSGLIAFVILAGMVSLIPITVCISLCFMSSPWRENEANVYPISRGRILEQVV